MALQLSQDLLGSRDHRFGQASQLSHVDPIAPVSASRDNLVQKNDFISFLRHHYVEVLHSGQDASQFNQLMIMGGEKGLRSKVGMVMDELGYCPGNGQSVVSGSAPPNLVQDYEGTRGSIVQNIRGFSHLDHKSGLSGGQILLCADARKDAINSSNIRGISRDEASN